MQNKKTIRNFAAIILLISITIPMIASTALGAVPVHHKATHAYIGATPNPVGVSQETLIHVGITDELELVTDGWEEVRRRDATVLLLKGDAFSQK